MPAISGPLMISSGSRSLQRQVEVGDQPVLGALDDVAGEALVERQRRLLGRLARLAVAEMAAKAAMGSRAAVQEEVLGRAFAPRPGCEA